MAVWLLADRSSASAAQATRERTAGHLTSNSQDLWIKIFQAAAGAGLVGEPFDELAALKPAVSALASEPIPVVSETSPDTAVPHGAVHVTTSCGGCLPEDSFEEK
jgi:hypothetical protein